ncbi:hypothetical protein XaraCFBP7407_11085 [Xanthomonas arboricola pv. arracaciae]|nr:hypothetical protein XaraCFBP7407_11085 [Xanthomonas arboricola pv. arracaciae]
MKLVLVGADAVRRANERRWCALDALDAQYAQSARAALGDCWMPMRLQAPRPIPTQRLQADAGRQGENAQRR